MKKSIRDYARKGRTIVTTNGVKTQTAAMYVTTLKDFVPLPNGFNKALADEIVETIEWSKGRLWHQDHWRGFMTGWEVSDEMADLLAELNPALVPDPKDDSERCGTTMCIAGWAGELTGADWVVDLVLGKKGYTAYDDFVFVRKDSLPEGFSTYSLTNEPFRYDLYKERLAKRGFTQETHTTMMVGEYARFAMGIGRDPLSLFDGDNAWWQVLGTIDAYTAFGADGAEDYEGDRFKALILAKGADRVVEEWGYTREEVDSYLESIEGQKIGFDYHRANAPEWAMAMDPV